MANEHMGMAEIVVVNGSFALPELRDFSIGVTCSNKGLEKVYSWGWLTESSGSSCMTLLMLQLPTFLLLTKLIYILLRPLKQPRIVCDFLGGVLLGPSLLPKELLRRFWFPAKCTLMLRTLAAYGIMYHLFLTGVKMDPSMILQSQKKVLLVGVFSLALPFSVVSLAFYYLRDLIIPTIALDRFYIFFIATISVSAFPVLGDILAEIGILNTELGRLAMSSSMINCIIGWFFMALFTVVSQVQYGWGQAGMAIVSLIAMVVGIVYGMGPFLQRIVQKTPRGLPVWEGYIFSILICVIALGLISDAIGASPMDGPLILGLLVLDGPPLGSALVQRLELVVEEMLMPLFFFAVGNIIEIPPVKVWLQWSPVAAIVLLGYAAKVLGTMLPAVGCKIPLHQAALLGMIMSFRGVVEIITLYFLRYGSLLDNEGFTLLVMLVMFSTGFAAPIVSSLYNPQASFLMCRRTIQHLNTNEEFVILSCVHSEDPVSATIGLIEASSADGPMTIYALNLVELQGRATSTLIAHKDKRGYLNPGSMDRHLQVFTNYEQDKKRTVVVMPFTTISHYRSMHQEICALAGKKKAVFIVVPYPRRDPMVEDTTPDHAVRSIIPEVLSQAPCSVGILVYQTLNIAMLPLPMNFQHNVGVLFWGGPDDRESLMYASRMAKHIGVILRVTRFVSLIDSRDDKERQMDDSLVEGVKIVHSSNDRFIFKDVFVKDVEETFSVIRSLDRDYDLLITGHSQGPNSYLTEELIQWSESPELGLVGDTLASQDFKRLYSILIVHQHR